MLFPKDIEFGTNMPSVTLEENYKTLLNKIMEDDELFDPKIDDDDTDDEVDDILTSGKKKPKKVDDDLLSDTTDSLDELADAELGEDEPYDDVDRW